MKVFIVEKYGGQYEDSWEYVDKVFDDQRGKDIDTIFASSSDYSCGFYVKNNCKLIHI